MKQSCFFAAALLAAASACGAFERPGENERANALGNLHEGTEVMRLLLTPDDDFAPIPHPGPSDWLAYHRETGQTFAQYRDSGANRPDATRRVIYLQPLGDFPADSSPPLEEIRAYAATYFQMEVRLLPTYQPESMQFEPRLNPRTKQLQILTRSVTAFLRARLPADAYCLLGLTMADLFPGPRWNFVFGEASLSERVGVFSFVRYDPAFFDEERPVNYQDLILKRSCKVLAHEIGHMFGLPHCIYYECVLNGSNHLSETDSKPQHLCPVCLRKLQSCAGFGAVKRYEELGRFYHRHRWYEDSDWINRQLKKARKESRVRLKSRAVRQPAG